MHVDLIKNDWDAGVQILVAQADALDSDVKVDSQAGAEWEALLRQPILDRSTGEKLYPQDNPVLFLERLCETISGSFYFVTRPHEREECLFKDDVKRVPFKPADIH